MRCPYLKEATVKYCRVSAFKKMIVQTPIQADHEKCSTEDYAACPLARQHGTKIATESRCPFLKEAPAQYCSASSVKKFIPYGETLLSRCSDGEYRACELFCAHAGNPKGAGLG